MVVMKLRTLGITSLSMGAILAFGQDQDAKVARGKYLVEEVARCQECHTPKTERGDYIKSQWMKGATLDFMPAVAVPGWKPKSPDVTSGSTFFARWGVDGLVKFLETGKNPRGNKAAAPMPSYALNREDAEAVVAFLKTLP